MINSKSTLNSETNNGEKLYDDFDLSPSTGKSEKSWAILSWGVTCLINSNLKPGSSGMRESSEFHKKNKNY